MKRILIDVPYIEQTKSSANCGPCSVQSIIEYFNIKKEDGTPYSTQSINKLIRTTKEYGAEEEDILDFFSRVGLSYNQINLSQIKEALKRNNPILAVFEDELHEGHFAVICGLEIGADGSQHFIFQDPWPDFGMHFKRNLESFSKQTEKFGNWFVEVKNDQKKNHP